MNAKEIIRKHYERIGAKGGHKTSTAKQRAARANGKLGGRPKTSTAKKQKD